MTSSNMSRGPIMALVVSVLVASPLGALATTQHNINFDDYDGIYWTVGQSRTTFAVPSKGGVGKAVNCNPATEFCWKYSQDTWDDQSNHYWFYVNDTQYGHYHLDFEDPSFYAQPGGAYCFSTTPSDGDGSGIVPYLGGACTTAPIDWAAEPRSLSPHGSGEIFDMFPDVWREFDATSIWNKGTVKIEIIILANDYNYYALDNLAAQTVHDISWFSWGIYEMWVTEASSDEGVIELDDVHIAYN